MTKRIFKIVLYILIFLLFTIFIITKYINNYFHNIGFDQLLYTLNTAQGTSVDAISGGIKYTLSNLVIFITILIVHEFLAQRNKYNYLIKLNFRKFSKKIKVYPFSKMKKIIVIVIYFVILISLSIKNLNLIDYIKLQYSYSELFENYYVNPKKVDIKIPKKKKNLIHIYVESLEMTNVSQKNGGAVPESYITNLEEIALENTNFSNTSKLGGALQVKGTTWTSAGMVAHTAGIPLKIPGDGNDYRSKDKFLSGAYSMGEVLADYGYENYFLLGSSADFGGREEYFKQHGNYHIYDYKWAQKKKYIDKDYYVWWGYEDKKLFSYAKDSLKKISSKNEPFNFTMLTADTHFYDGYLDESCDAELFESPYANVFNCSDSMINKFLNWIKKQDFYNDTVIVISGDHLTMQKGFYKDLDSKYKRTVYETIINSETKPKKEKNRRYSTMDMYPTILSALGCKIDGERLGLGTNLYSNKKTLIEKIGYKQFNEELGKSSKFYNKFILGDDDYYSLKEKADELEKLKEKD